MTRIFTDEEEFAICQLYLSGMSSRAVADTVYCSHRTVINILKRMNIERRLPDSNAIIERNKRIRELRHQGKSAKELADMFGLKNASSVYEVLTRGKTTHANA